MKLAEKRGRVVMKRYLVMDEPYGGKGILGSVDSLDDIPYNHYEAVDTTTGIIYRHYDGTREKGGWEPDGNVPEIIKVRNEDPFEHTEEEPIKNIYYVDIVNGSDDNDGLDMNTPLQTLSAALELSDKSPGRSRIYVMGD